MKTLILGIIIGVFLSSAINLPLILLFNPPSEISMLMGASCGIFGMAFAIDKWGL